MNHTALFVWVGSSRVALSFRIAATEKERTTRPLPHLKSIKSSLYFAPYRLPFEPFKPQKQPVCRVLSIRMHTFAEIHGKEHEISKRDLAIAVQIVKTVETRVIPVQSEVACKQKKVAEAH